MHKNLDPKSIHWRRVNSEPKELLRPNAIKKRQLERLNLRHGKSISSAIKHESGFVELNSSLRSEAEPTVFEVINNDDLKRDMPFMVGKVSYDTCIYIF